MQRLLLLKIPVPCFVPARTQGGAEVAWQLASVAKTKVHRGESVFLLGGYMFIYSIRGSRKQAYFAIILSTSEVLTPTSR